MRVSFILGVLMLLLAACRADEATGRAVMRSDLDPGRIRLEIQQAKTGGATIKMSMTNQSRDPIAIFERVLPWKNRYSLVALASPASKPESPLSVVFAIDDSPTATVTIQPGTTLGGEVDLSKRFPALSETLKHDDVFVFWTYDFREKDGQSTRYFGGLTLSGGK